MFSLKRSSEQNSTSINSDTALPNHYGKIRTLKEDFEDLKSGKREAEEKSSSLTPQKPEATRNLGATSPLFPVQQPQQSAPPVSPPLASQFPSQPKPESKLSPAAGTGAKENPPAPFGTESYFSEKSPFENIDQLPKAEEAGKTQEKKSSNLFTIITSLLLLLIISGGGFYYYWFYIKKSLPVQTQTTAQTQKATSNQNQIQQVPEGKNIRALTVDPAAGGTEIKKSFQKMAADFLSSASENELNEIRPAGKDNQQIPVESFVSLFSITLPESITQGFSSDAYGLFIKKENGEIRTGLVFELSDPTGLAEKLAQQEKNLPAELNSLYLNQEVPGAEFAFNSSKYKNADIRYYNFPSPPNTSLDYSVIRGKDTSYLIFATSKETLHSILDYMSEK